MSASKQKQMFRLQKHTLIQRKKKYIGSAPDIKRHLRANQFKKWRNGKC